MSLEQNSNFMKNSSTDSQNRSNSNTRYRLVVDCDDAEWNTSYIFVDKSYSFRVSLAEILQKKQHPHCSRTSKARTRNTPKLERVPEKDPNTNTNTNTPEPEPPHQPHQPQPPPRQRPFRIQIACLDNDGKPLQQPSEHTLSPSTPLLLNGVDDCCAFSCSIACLSFLRGDSQFRLRFSCDSSAIETEHANRTLTAVRVIRYKLAIQSAPEQLRVDENKFYKDIKPKTNFLCFELCLRDKDGNVVAPPPHKVELKTVLFFEDGVQCQRQNVLNVRGVSASSSCTQQRKSSPYSLQPRDGTCTIPLRVEETSTKYDNRRFCVQFVADSSQITANLEIAPVRSESFLVRTKINKYRLRTGNKQEQQQQPLQEQPKTPVVKMEKKKKKRRKLGERVAEPTRNSSSSSSRRIKREQQHTHLHSHSRSACVKHENATENKNMFLTTSSSSFSASHAVLPPPVPMIPPAALYRMASYIMPPLFATVPGMNLIKIDAQQQQQQQHGMHTAAFPAATASALTDRDYQQQQKQTRMKIRSQKRPRTPSPSQQNSNKRRRYNTRSNLKLPRVSLSPTVSVPEESSGNIRHDVDGDGEYQIDEQTEQAQLDKWTIATLRMLGECMGRREYFVSGTECHCYLKCLYCASVAYPPKQMEVQHAPSCLLVLEYQHITKYATQRLLTQAFSLSVTDLESLISSQQKTLQKPLSTAQLPRMPSFSIPPLVSEIPQIPAPPSMSASAAAATVTPAMMSNSMATNQKLQKAKQSNRFSLVRSDQCHSFNGLIGPFNSFFVPTNANPASENVLSTSTETQSLPSSNSTAVTFSQNSKTTTKPAAAPVRNRSGSFTFVPVPSLKQTQNKSDKKSVNVNQLASNKNNNSFGLLSIPTMSPIPVDLTNITLSGNLSNFGYGEFPSDLLGHSATPQAMKSEHRNNNNK